MPKKTKEAFLWIVSLLRKHKIPFQITGGFAARIYGSDRPLNDIDIEIPEEKFDELIRNAKQFITYGPKRYKDEVFDLELITISYKGQDIDISGSQSQRLYDRKKKRWITMRTDHGRSAKKKVYNLIVPLETKENILEYKKMIGRRDVDFQDIEALSG